MFVFKAAVVGAGTMGGEIAQVIAGAGIPVALKDVDQGALDAGLARARKVSETQAGRLVERDRLTQEGAAEQVAETLGRITATLDAAALGDADLVIEAVPERLELKQQVFAELDAATPGRAVLASNTSGLSITEIADATERPDQVVGFHCFWPPATMRLVEVVEGDETSPETLQTALTFAQAIRKTAIRCAECPGFVVNRILLATATEMWRHQEETGASVEDVDAEVERLGFVPMGPFRLADLTGLDTTVHVAQDLRDAYGDERFGVHAQMAELVGRGDLGRKSGRGFYAYD